MKKYKVMSMNTTITITSKGQTTIPVEIRRHFGIDKSGGELIANFDEKKGELIISKPTDINELTARISSYIKPGIKPLLNVDEFYQANREIK